MLRVYYCRLPSEEPSVPAGLLSAYRKEKLAAQTNALVRRQSLFSELLLRHALSDCGLPVETPLHIAAGEQGKPFFPNGECCFSLSHSAEAALCAVCDEAVGADIQLLSKARPALIKRFYAPDEQQYVLAASNADAAFTELWTKKESWCKLSGLGLSLALPSFSVLDDSIAPLLWHTTAGEYHIAVCSERLPGRIELIETNIDASARLP